MAAASTCEESILSYLSTSPDTTITDTYPWSNELKLDHNAVVGAVKSLAGDEYVIISELTSSFYTLSNEAMDVLTNGSQEIIVLSALIQTETDASSSSSSSSGLTMPELQSKVGKNVCKIGMGNCMKNKWVKKDGDKIIPIITSMDDVQDVTREQLKIVQECNGDVHSSSNIKEADINALKRRKLITLVKRVSYSVSRGLQYQPKRVKKAADLTKEMLDSGSWKTTTFKEYNFLTLGEKVGGGYLHPLLKVRAEFRKILMQMGFHEMPTNKWVESSFWNFDSLFQPQSHPARDAHDTFFIKEPAETVSVPEDYYERVKTMHEVGGSGSIGYRYDFKREGELSCCWG